jgi:carbonic anhydrase
MRGAFLVVIALSWPALPATAQHGAAPHWEYQGPDGPAHWATLAPVFRTCGVGTHQSPINISDPSPSDLPAIMFSYHPSALKLIDNGHTIQVNYAPGSFITVGGKKYELQQFHFHRPAEEQVSGNAYPLVAHLVHRSSDGRLAVVAILLTAGVANNLVDNLWKHLPAEKNRETTVPGVTVDVSHLLPTTRGYFSYEGSLTTPPCTEGVTWLVFKTPVQVSREEIDLFATRYPHNARPIQPLNGRVIRATK